MNAQPLNTSAIEVKWHMLNSHLSDITGFRLFYGERELERQKTITLPSTTFTFIVGDLGKYQYILLHLDG